jgi:A/G-specific adenine glycosylase
VPWQPLTSGGHTLLDPEGLTHRFNNAGTLSTIAIRSFQKTILDRFLANPRPMPWRTTLDPYHILVSEIMLQQTQVERVKAKYAEFLSGFPTVEDLASAPLVDVLRIWQGLGYNRRALALKRCAEEIMSRYGGRFPREIDELESLPGIGTYTARAIAAFAFGIAEPLIETNIRTVFIHFFFHGRDKISDREIMPLVAATLERQNPREWYYALMDFGVYLKQLHPNPSRRSSHHVQQSRFEGSNRQLRSRLLREIMTTPWISASLLAEQLGAEKSTVERNLADLEREGFLRRKKNRYVVQSSN